MLREVHHYFPVSWMVRTRGAGAAAAAAVQQVVAAAAPELPFIRFTTMHELIARDIAVERFLLTLLTVFATAAMALAATGLYGLMAYTVAQRWTSTAQRPLAILRPTPVQNVR